MQLELTIDDFVSKGVEKQTALSWWRVIPIKSSIYNDSLGVNPQDNLSCHSFQNEIMV